ncbi:hypothetical protein MKEN_00391400 [Mycena kentingensis (nom. inval.)]|nr:hypothetical protein MKEN_00391400 [Mycena kentingensis (nom. inval.)]
MDLSSSPVDSRPRVPHNRRPRYTYDLKGHSASTLPPRPQALCSLPPLLRRASDQCARVPHAVFLVAHSACPCGHSTRKRDRSPDASSSSKRARSDAYPSPAPTPNPTQAPTHSHDHDHQHGHGYGHGHGHGHHRQDSAYETPTPIRIYHPAQRPSLPSFAATSVPSHRADNSNGQADQPALNVAGGAPPPGGGDDPEDDDDDDQPDGNPPPNNNQPPGPVGRLPPPPPPPRQQKTSAVGQGDPQDRYDEYAGIDDSRLHRNYRKADLDSTFTTVFNELDGRCPGCLVRGIPGWETHTLENCPCKLGWSLTDRIYGTWHKNSFEFKRYLYCWHCLMPLITNWGMHDDTPTACNDAHYLKPAFYCLVANVDPAPHVYDTRLFPKSIVTHDAPFLFAYTEWASKPIPGTNLLYLHAILLYIFEQRGLITVPKSLVPVIAFVRRAAATYNIDNDPAFK